MKHYVHPHQAAEQGAWGWGPLQNQVQVPWLPKDPHPQEMGIYWFNVDEFENMVAEKQLIPGGYRSDTSLTMTSGQMTVSAVSRETAMAPHSSTLAWENPMDGEAW